MRAAPCVQFAARLALRSFEGTVPLCARRASRSYSPRVGSARVGVPTFANAPIAGPSPALSIAMAEMNDYPVDEARVMRGEDDRIASAVESAVAMGFDADAATEAAKREIIKYPGRPDVTELVVDALLSDIGGGERALQLPSVMPQRYADAAAAAAERGAASASRAIDLTEDSPRAATPSDVKHPSTRAKGKPSRSRSSPWTTTTETARTTERPTPPRAVETRSWHSWPRNGARGKRRAAAHRPLEDPSPQRRVPPPATPRARLSSAPAAPAAGVAGVWL